MAFIPDDTRWYLAELINEITVEGDTRNVLHRNLTLIEARLPEEAYDSALRIGRGGEVQYLNPSEKWVTIRFRGIRQLSAIYEPMIHGAELLYVEQIGVSEQEILRELPSREELSVFRQVEESRGPDYSAA